MVTVGSEWRLAPSARHNVVTRPWAGLFTLQLSKELSCFYSGLVTISPSLQILPLHPYPSSGALWLVQALLTKYLDRYYNGPLPILLILLFILKPLFKICISWFHDSALPLWLCNTPYRHSILTTWIIGWRQYYSTSISVTWSLEHFCMAHKNYSWFILNLTWKLLLESAIDNCQHVW